MIHHREGFEQLYDFRENIAPKEHDYVVSEKDAEDFSHAKRSHSTACCASQG
ncbi:MAG TPA: hypothetical protein VK900_06460 [Anaerolineales bacterium]|nr:hypothetical protein [Anaerolineales bacterium]